MKKFLVLFVMVSLLSSPLMAINMKLITKGKDDIIRQDSFSNLVKKVYCTPAVDEYVTPNDIVSTNSYALAYLGSVVGPVKVRIQNLGTTGKIHYREYATSVAVGIDPTVATDSYLATKHGMYLATGTAGQLAPGEVYEEIYYGEPDKIFGGVELSTFTVEIFKQISQ